MTLFRTIGRLAPLGAALLLAACNESGSVSQRSLAPIPPETIALMEQAGVSKDAPTLIRSYKKEAELEIWKMRPDGRYVHLKTFPMCRWSGQLGPKVREGDRQAPEGFYAVTPAQMNPGSSYYLSFNVGYPNAYDRAMGHGGGSIMVHGACSSAGCFSMTDRQIAEIYSIMRTSFNNGQRAIQMQSYPFKMTAENLAKHRLDPNIGFWRQLKEGSDHFEVAGGREPNVSVCGRRYVFDAAAANGQALEASAPCPTLKRDAGIEAQVAQKAAQDEARVAELVAAGVKPVRIVYQDGGQHPEFRFRVAEVSRPEALAAEPVEIALQDKSPKPPGKPGARSASILASAAPKATGPAETIAAPTAGAPEPARPNVFAGATESIGGWLGMRKEEPAPAAAPEEAISAAALTAPLPPKKPQALLGGRARVAATATGAPLLRDSLAPQP